MDKKKKTVISVVAVLAVVIVIAAVLCFALIYSAKNSDKGQHKHTLVHHDAQPATCTEIGWKEYDTCSTCDYSTYEEIPAIGHNYVNYVCENCKEALKTSTGLKYRLNSDKTSYCVSGIGDCTDTEVVIPSVYEGLPVNSIYMYAFQNSSVKSVTIPETFTKIDGYAFYKCATLETVNIPKTVTEISNYAFNDCTSLTGVVIPENVTVIETRAFYNCSSITDIKIPDGVNFIGEDAFTNTAYHNNESNWENGALFNGKFLLEVRNDYSGDFNIKTDIKGIANGAFRGCENLTGVTIPQSVEFVGSYTFYNCSSLKSVNFPAAANYIGILVLYGCTSLEEIIVAEGNTNYESIGNCFIEKQTKTLIYGCNNSVIPNDYGITKIQEYAFYGYDKLSEITIPNSVKSIEKYAFNECSSLTSVTIPNSVTSIGGYAFNECSSLTSITIPNSVTSIGGYAFRDCKKLTSVTFENTVGWKKAAYPSKNFASEDLAVPTTAAKYLTTTYNNSEWTRS